MGKRDILSLAQGAVREKRRTSIDMAPKDVREDCYKLAEAWHKGELGSATLIGLYRTLKRVHGSRVGFAETTFKVWMHRQRPDEA